MLLIVLVVIALLTMCKYKKSYSVSLSYYLDKLLQHGHLKVLNNLRWRRYDLNASLFF